MHRIGLLIALLSVASLCYAIDTSEAFSDPELQARYEGLIAEVRCVTCQNQSIKDSNALIASDLRREIRRMLGEGQSNAEISDFLVTRYGDFILYRPQFAGKTMFVWIAPFLFVLLGVIVVVRVIRYRMTLSIDDGDSE